MFASSAEWRCAVLVNWFVSVLDFQMIKKGDRCDNNNDDVEGCEQSPKHLSSPLPLPRKVYIQHSRICQLNNGTTWLNPGCMLIYFMMYKYIPHRCIMRYCQPRLYALHVNMLDLLSTFYENVQLL